MLRAAPCLFGLYTVIALLYQALPESKRSGRVEWPGKVGVTFSDALTCVRRWLWREWVLPQVGGNEPVDQLPESLHKILMAHDSRSVDRGFLRISLRKSSLTRLRLLAHSKIAT